MVGDLFLLVVTVLKEVVVVVFQEAIIVVLPKLVVVKPQETKIQDHTLQDHEDHG
jgi:hypothetical protein